MTPEGAVKRDIKKYLDSIGAYHVWPVPTGYGSPMVDCYACVDGRFWAIEVKAPGKWSTKRQQLIINKVNECRGAAVVVDSLIKLKSYMQYVVQPRT
jgi:hypothetical protein